MKALTVWQPFAGLIVAGVKPVENWTWAPKLAIGERFAIHAGKDSGVEAWVEKELAKADREGVVREEMFETGAVVGTVRFAGIARNSNLVRLDKRKWFFGPVGWLLEDPRPILKPVKVRGALGLWDLPEIVFSSIA